MDRKDSAKKSGPVSVHVKMSSGQIIWRHLDHVHKHWPTLVANNPNISDSNPVADGYEPSTAMEKVLEDNLLLLPVCQQTSDQPHQNLNRLASQWSDIHTGSTLSHSTL